MANTNQQVARRPLAGSPDFVKAESYSVQKTLEKLAPQMAQALPKHLSAERLMRVVMTSVRTNPKLLECDRASFFSAVMTCAQLGLEPDGVLGQAYLIPFKGKVQFIPGYKGLLSLARNSGDVVSISAHEVCANDQFDYAFGLSERLEHKPASGDRGEITHFWALARFKDGGYHFDVMTKAEVDAIRDGSQGWKSAVETARKYNKTNSSPWATHYNEMGRKTAIRRIVKYLPLSVQKAMALSDSYESGKAASLGEAGELVIDAPATEVEMPAQVGRRSQLDDFEDAPAHDPETGEIVSNKADLAAAQSALMPRPPWPRSKRCGTGCRMRSAMPWAGPRMRMPLPA